METIKENIIQFIIPKVKKISGFKQLFLTGSNGMHSSINQERDLDFILIVSDTTNIVDCSLQLSPIIKEMIITFELKVSIYPMQERTYLKGQSMFIENIKNHQEEIL